MSGGLDGGTDTLSGIEVLSFIDGQLSFHRDGLAAQVMRLYDSAFNRVPDAGGFEILLDALEGGMSLETLSQEFVNSVEFQNLYGNPSNQQFVEQLYRNVLDREGDAGGIQTWTNALNGGTHTRAQVLLAFSESAEHKDVTQGTLDQGLWVADDLALQIARLYDAAWNRLPDEGGLMTWRNALGGGMTLQAIADLFAGAAEFTNTYGNLTNRQFVEQMYLNVLNRAGDAGGLDTWTNALDGGTYTRGQVMLAFSESAEHVALMRDSFVGGIRTQEYPGSAPLAADDAGPQVLPAEPVDTGLITKHGQDDLGPQVLIGAEDDGFVLPKGLDDSFGPQVLPGAELDTFTQAKLDGDFGPQVLPGAEDDGFGPQVLPGADTDGQPHNLAALEARLHGHDHNPMLDDPFLGLNPEAWHS
ncbi:MAG: DUF4214 domain-containing protein [Brevundimonas sp.]|nr:MAG: DUF4214 domain-containing protein [Brevundimonas sp.]